MNHLGRGNLTDGRTLLVVGVEEGGDPFPKNTMPLTREEIQDYQEKFTAGLPAGPFVEGLAEAFSGPFALPSYLLANLYPIPKNGLSTSVKTVVDLEKLDFKSVQCYHNYVKKARWPKLSRERRSLAPRVTLCFSKTHWDNFRSALFTLQDEPGGDDFRLTASNRMMVSNKYQAILLYHPSRNQLTKADAQEASCYINRGLAANPA